MQNEKVPAAMQDNVTQDDLRWRKRFHEITGHVDMDMSLAKLIARHRLASTTAQSEAVQKLVDALEVAIGLLWEHCEGIAPRIEPLESALASHRESNQPTNTTR